MSGLQGPDARRASRENAHALHLSEVRRVSDHPSQDTAGAVEDVVIIPQIRCRSLARAVHFYTHVLDFEYVEGDDPEGAKGFCVLSRRGDLVFLCSYDGGDRSVIAIMTDDVDADCRTFRARGLQTPGEPDVPAEEVHQGPLDQSWGTREFYVQDPDGNSLRFTQSCAPRAAG